MKTANYHIVAIAIIVLSIIYAFATYQNPQAGNRDTRSLYLQHCASCHGEKLDRFAARQWVYGSTVKDVSSTLKNGRPSIGMPEFSKAMNDDEIREMAIYMINEVAKVPAIQVSTFNEKDTFQTESFKFVLHKVLSDSLNIPWGLAFLPNGDMLVTEKTGKLFQISNGKMLSVSGVPKITVKGQGGLMDVAVHPDFAKNQFIYLSYAEAEEENMVNTSIARAQLKDGKLIDLKRIAHGLPNTNTGAHYGARIVFDNEGYLYYPIGDRGTKENAQNLSNYNGKIHRIHDDGSIPKDNPFVNTPNAIPSIWSYGHRNPQGLYFDKKTNILWESEHGPKGGDELNIIKKAVNYGWPLISFGVNYDGTLFTQDTAMADMEQPVFYWIPSIAPSSLLKVSSSIYKGWEGDFLNGSLNYEYLERLKMKNNKVVGREKLLQKIGRLRNVVQSPDGYIYISVEKPGRVYKLLPIK